METTMNPKRRPRELSGGLAMLQANIDWEAPLRNNLAIAIKTIAVSASLVLAGCASAPPIDQVELMPAPDVYGDGLINPLPEQDPAERIPYDGILFATDRKPASEADEEKYYLNDRGRILRVGVAQVHLGEKQFTWDKAREISMLTSRTEKYPVKISNVDEWGILSASVPFWLDIDMDTNGNAPPDGSDRFSKAIDAQMAQSGKKDVYIYVHGYKVAYENPLLVSAELWHFLGYKGAFIAYAWPSTPSKFAYIKDSDTSAGYARNLRLLLEFIAENTEVENVHIIGYSNGTRLVSRAMEQLALKHHDESPDKIFEELRIRNVILVGSDLDRGVFDSYLADGLMNVSKHLSIYMSEHDKALGVSQFLTRRERLGQMFGEDDGKLTQSERNALVEYRDRLSLINVTDAEGAGTGNGHGYFRSSPWASSDVLMTLYYGLSPQQRGLVEQEDLPIYTFPPDYIERMWAAIEDVDPQFAENYRALKESMSEPAGAAN
jgi:esterase/lipase superfamily enzyme